MAVKSTNAQKLHILNMINERKDSLLETGKIGFHLLSTKLIFES